MRKYVIACVLVALGAPATAALSAPAKAPKAALTLAANPSTIVSGHATTLSGQLTGGKPAGKKVDVQADFFPYDGRFAKVATATTAANGTWSAAARPPINARLRAHQGKTNSPVVTVLVRIRVSLRLSDRTPKAGRRVRFSGRAYP